MPCVLKLYFFLLKGINMDTMIIFENQQDLMNLTDEHISIIENVVSKTLELENFNIDTIVSVTAVDNEQIHSLNNEFRGVDRPTDVLSFPVVEFENGKMIENSGDYFEDKLILGDIIFSAEKLKEQSIEYGHSFERELGFLVCHSTLHLLGYDHETEEERQVMRQKEENTLQTLNLTR